jgi:Domain of unknown function (DUF4082)/Fibronectin type III domain
MNRALALLLGLFVSAAGADPLTVTLVWDPVTHNTDVTGYQIGYGTQPNQYATIQNVDGVATDTATITGLDTQTVYYFAIRSIDANDTNKFSEWTPSISNATLPGAGNLTIVSAPQPPTCQVQSFLCDLVPAQIDAGGEYTPVEVGVQFNASVPGNVTGVIFYKAETNTSTHTIELWDSATGQELATAPSSNETASGLQYVNFTTPVHINANHYYTVSYHTNSGHYSATTNYWTTAVTDGQLTYPGGGEGQQNGVYAYGSADTPSFPTQTYQNTNYFVAAMFTPDQ